MPGSGSTYARIIALEDFAGLRDTLAGKIVCTSGGYDPLHPGHATCIIESKALGDVLVVVVNGDSFLAAKKGRPFQDLRTRCMIVSCIRGVDFVVPFERPGVMTVDEALEKIRPAIFTKGGDRCDAGTIPEWTTCQRLGIQLVSGVGHAKEWSSSDFLKEWGEYWARRDCRMPNEK